MYIVWTNETSSQVHLKNIQDKTSQEMDVHEVYVNYMQQ